MHVAYVFYVDVLDRLEMYALLCFSVPFIASWYIKWGDGTFESGKLDPLLQVQRIHTYPSRCQSYRITAYYCSDYTAVTSTSTFPNCDSYTRCVDVAYDPQFGH